MTPYPKSFPITPLAAPPHVTVTVPGSKSITNRALVLAALACGHGCQGCELEDALLSDDTEVMLESLRRLGFYAHRRRDISRTVVLKVFKRDPSVPALFPPSADLFVGNSGTSVRFLAAMLALGQGEYRLDGVPRMRERPIEDLLAALRQLGVTAESENGTGCPPIRIRANGLRGGQVSVKADKSSQFLSALLLAAPFATGDTTIQIEGEAVSEPYISMTVGMLGQWGLTVAAPTPGTFQVPGNQRVTLSDNYVDYPIEPDASSASYFFAAAAITGGSVTVRGMKRDMLQGDVTFVDCLQAMGCEVTESAEGITVVGKPLEGIDTDMNAISDTVMTLAAVACFAEGATTIRNVAHIRHKETDRIAAVAAELRKLGAEVTETADGLTITPRPLTGCAVDTYDDHRMAMSLALVGLRVPGVVINDPGCVAKTYPGFWDDFAALGG